MEYSGITLTSSSLFNLVTNPQFEEVSFVEVMEIWSPTESVIFRINVEKCKVQCVVCRLQMMMLFSIGEGVDDDDDNIDNDDF